DRPAEILEPVVEHGPLGDAPLPAALFQAVEVAAADDGVALLLAHVYAVIGGHLGLDLRGLAGQLDVALAQHVLRHRDRRRAGHDPGEVGVEIAGEHAVIRRGIRPVGAADQVGVAPILAAGEAPDAVADLLALEQGL